MVEPVWDFTDFILLAEPEACAICTRPTCWVELNFQVHLHPGPCDVRMWADYNEACRRVIAVQESANEILNAAYLSHIFLLLVGILFSLLIWTLVFSVLFFFFQVPLKYGQSVLDTGMAISYVVAFFLSYTHGHPTAISPLFLLGTAFHLWWANKNWPDDEQKKKRKQSVVEKVVILLSGKLGLSPS